MEVSQLHVGGGRGIMEVSLQYCGRRKGNVEVRVSILFYCRRRKGNVEVSLLLVGG